MKLWESNVFSPVHLSVILLTVLAGRGSHCTRPWPQTTSFQGSVKQGPCTGPCPQTCSNLLKVDLIAQGPPDMLKLLQYEACISYWNTFLLSFEIERLLGHEHKNRKKLFTETYTLLMSHQMWQQR